MNRLRRLVAPVSLTAALGLATACVPGAGQSNNMGPGPCGQWYGLALNSGFTHDQWMSPLKRIMNAESGCDPSAYNPSGATGLLQIMPMWADDCGTTPQGLFDPVINVRCGRHVYEVQGWTAWSTY